MYYNYTRFVCESCSRERGNEIVYRYVNGLYIIFSMLCTSPNNCHLDHKILRARMKIEFAKVHVMFYTITDETIHLGFFKFIS